MQAVPGLADCDLGGAPGGMARAGIPRSDQGRGRQGLGASGFNRKTQNVGSPRREHAVAGTPVGVRAAAVAEAIAAGPRLGWHEAIAATVTGLGYELVDVERALRGLLRVTIDRLPGRSYMRGRGPDATPDAGEAVTVDDCERVTRQLQFALEVEGLEYARLEVSSPGLDRALRREADYERFVGQVLSLTLKQPFEGRKSWQGVLSHGESGGWKLQFKNGKNEQELGFTFEEVREARLVPVVDFKGRQSKVTQDDGADKAAAQAAPEVDGGL